MSKATQVAAPLGAILVCVSLLVSIAVVQCELGEEKGAITKLNQLLAFDDAIGYNNNDLIANLQRVATEDKSRGLGLFEGDLSTAIERFSTVLSAQNCTLELANAMGYLLNDLSSQTRVNQLLGDVFSTNTNLYKQCASSLASLAKQFIVSQLPQDEAMQTYLRHVSHSKFGSKYNPFKLDEFYSEYHRKAPIVDELLAIAEEKSIVLVDNKLNVVLGEVISTVNDQQYDDMLETYYAEPCRRHLRLSANFLRFIDLMQRLQPINMMPIRIWSIAYRVQACQVYQGLGPDNQLANIRRLVVERYSQAHPAITMKPDGGLLLSSAAKDITNLKQQ